MRMSRLSPLLVTLAAGIPVLAQGTQTSTITLEVVDAKKKPLAGALVRISSPALQGERQGRTDEAGRYRAPLLPPGDYKVAISKDGLETVSLSQHLGLEQTFNPRVVLKVASGAIVEVTTTNASADKAEFKSAQNYSKEQIEAIPVNRNTLLDIAYLTPGVVANENADRGSVQIRGSMGTGNVFLVDGQNINDNLYMGSRIGIIFDSVDETVVLTGALPAEYGDVEGGVVNSVTKSGSDQFEGTLRYDLANPSWNARKPLSDRSAYDSNLSSQRTLQLGGPIIPGRLWFHFGYFDQHPRDIASIASDTYFDSVGNITGNPPVSGDPGSYYTGGGYTYQKKADDYRREIKLTGALTQDHTLSLSYHNQSKIGLADYGAGEPAALTNLVLKSNFWNASLRSIWSAWATTSIRFGFKHQYLGSEGGDTGQWLINNENSPYPAYRNTYFNPNDPAMDVRENHTANFKASFFVDWHGSHEIDAGLDWYNGTTVASGDGSPTTITGPAGTPVAGRRLNNWWVDVFDFDPIAQTSGVYDVYFSEWVVDKTENTTLGFYLNDKWTLNQNWLFQIGARLDSYDYTSKAVGKVSSGSGFLSPRLGLKWDVQGDASWVAGLSYAKYNGKVLEGTLTNASYVNTPRLWAFAWAGPARATNADIANLANWDFMNVYDYSDSASTTKFNPHLKPQTVTEIQGTLTHPFHSDRLGQGFVKATLVAKDWNNLIDFRSGNDGTVPNPFDATAPYYVRYYFNNPDAKRTYRALELEANLAKGPLSVAAYMSWSSLRGNFVGEERANPGKGQGLYNFSNVGGTQLYDPALLNPTGYLPGHTPFRSQLIVTYTMSNFLGQQTYGLVTRWTAGDRYSTSRTVSASALTDPAGPGLPSQFGSKAVMYQGERGAEAFPNVMTMDFTFMEKVDLWKLANGRAAQGFLKLDIGNVLNHQQKQSFEVGYNRAYDSYTEAWSPVDGWGTATGSADYIDGRTLKLGVGVKF